MTIPSKIGHPDFSKLIAHLEEGMANVNTEDGHPGKDFEHYTFEIAMEALYGPSIWPWFNSKVNW